ncbi:MAG: ComF family protein [Hormoscilla sp. GM102CHS1]|nr:ComF family protein [Hormoscilla sp. GM102CHS1]
MARTYQPVAVCGESRQYGSEWEGCPARDSSTPTSLTERQQILADALSVGKSLTQKRPQRVLLLDDIYTTGTTVGEAARVLRRQGISVYGVVAIATTNKSPGSGS